MRLRTTAPLLLLGPLLLGAATPTGPEDAKNNAIVYAGDDSNATLQYEGSFAKEFLPIMYLLDHLSPSALKTIVHGIKRGQASWVTCMLCSTSVGLIRLFPEVSTVQTIFTQICSKFKYEDYTVCTGLAELYGDEFIYILRHSKLYTNEICGLIINPSCMSASSDFPYGQQWTFPIAEPSPSVQTILDRESERQERLRLASNGKSPEKNVSMILHLSDLHLDQKYQVNTFAFCTEPLCCRSSSVPTTKSVRSGYWGSMGACDTNIHTIESLYQTIATPPIVDQYRYVIFTGDYIAHDVWLTTKEEIFSTTRRLNGDFRRRLPKNKVVIPVIGNHEGYPVDQFCPPEINATRFHMDWLYEELLDQWKDWIPESQHELFRKFGYYSLIDQKTKWIVLNMNYCNRLNFWIVYDYREMGGMLAWLERELGAAAQAGQSVYIAGHIAPDPADCIDNWIAAYQRITARYAPIIRGQFFGHTHFDEIRLYYDDENEPTSVAYLAPSVTTFGDVHPSFRLYNTDPETGEIVDHRTFILNITRANEEHLLKAPFRQTTPLWELLYSARDSYNLTGLSVQHWHDFVATARNRPELVRRYYRHYGRYDDSVMAHTAFASMANSLFDRYKVKSV